MRLTVTLAGVDVLSLRTKALIAAARRGLSDGVSEGAQILVSEAQAIVPVDTGHLRDSIHAELVEATETKITVAVMPDTPYAARIEFGFVGIDSLGRHYHNPAQPYLRPAWDSRIDEVTQTIKDRIYESLDEAIAR